MAERTRVCRFSFSGGGQGALSQTGKFCTRCIWKEMKNMGYYSMWGKLMLWFSQTQSGGKIDKRIILLNWTTNKLSMVLGNCFLYLMTLSVLRVYSGREITCTHKLIMLTLLPYLPHLVTSRPDNTISQLRPKSIMTDRKIGHRFLPSFYLHLCNWLCSFFQ